MYMIVPLTTDPNQNFNCTLPVDNANITLFFDLSYNTNNFCWFMTVSDSNKNVLVDSIALVCGINLLAAYSYLRIGSAYIVKIINSESDIPDDSSLGKDYVLVWGDTDG